MVNALRHYAGAHQPILSSDDQSNEVRNQSAAGLTRDTIVLSVLFVSETWIPDVGQVHN